MSERESERASESGGGTMWKCESANCLQGNMEAQMKARKGWKDSRCCDWSWFDTHRLGEERTWNAAAPQVLVCCVELGQMTSFWQDYPKPGFNLYVRIIHFYNMTMTKDSKKDSLIPGFHASISLGFGLIVKDKLSHLKAIHMISLEYHLETWTSQTE